MSSIVQILKEATRLRASDVHFISNSPVMVRVNGELVSLPGTPPLDPTACVGMIYELLSPAQRTNFEKNLYVDATFGLENVRYRLSVTLQKQGVEGVCRVIPSDIPSPEDIQLPASVVRMAELKRGLVLVTGPTGSGKSTTLACLVERINQTRRAKIITLEDPIEFLYTNKQSVISQREVGQHTTSFSRSLREILRQDPDVVMVGEMRDHETMEAALQVADTGHLVLATLHSSDAPQAVERIIDVFSGTQQAQIRANLAANLKCVVGQTLLPRKDRPGRVCAFEVMIVNSAIAAQIRQGRTHEIPGAMEMGNNEGMVTQARAFGDLVRLSVIDATLAPPVSMSQSPKIERRKIV